MKEYKSFAELWRDFITGKIAVKTPDGRIGLYSNCPDWAYWQPILRNIYNKENVK